MATPPYAAFFFLYLLAKVFVHVLAAVHRPGSYAYWVIAGPRLIIHALIPVELVVIIIVSSLASSLPVATPVAIPVAVIVVAAAIVSAAIVAAIVVVMGLVKCAEISWRAVARRAVIPPGAGMTYARATSRYWMVLQTRGGAAATESHGDPPTGPNGKPN